MIADDSRALLAVSYLDNCPEPLMTSRASMRASHISDSTAFRRSPAPEGHRGRRAPEVVWRCLSQHMHTNSHASMRDAARPPTAEPSIDASYVGALSVVVVSAVCCSGVSSVALVCFWVARL